MGFFCIDYCGKRAGGVCGVTDKRAKADFFFNVYVPGIYQASK